ncbi:MAG: hypothetical protein KAR06_00350 [Deltaproteobacteria bacterium]|nr:hypothetical protein [Deltaproteobacteria bacterium]
MKKGGGKGKGSEFERGVCKDLSRWLSYQERDDLLWRSAMSGGRATVQFKKGKKASTQAGDLSSIDPLGHKLIDKFVVECKFYKDLRIDSLIYHEPVTNTIYDFWNILRKEAIDHDKNPMIIARQNNKRTLIGLNDNGVRILFPKKSDRLPYSYFESLNLYLFDYASFLGDVDPAVLELP